MHEGIAGRLLTGSSWLGNDELFVAWILVNLTQICRQGKLFEDVVMV